VDDLRRPSTTFGNLRQPSATFGNLRQPSATFGNLPGLTWNSKGRQEGGGQEKTVDFFTTEYADYGVRNAECGRVKKSKTSKRGYPQFNRSYPRLPAVDS
jgi:hypothetical protein